MTDLSQIANPLLKFYLGPTQTKKILGPNPDLQKEINNGLTSDNPIHSHRGTGEGVEVGAAVVDVSRLVRRDGDPSW